MKHKTQKVIVCPGLSPEVMENIESRAKVLSRQFWNLEYEDLLHDGIILVLEIRKDKPSCTDPYLFGAINNYYSDVMKEAIEYKRNRREIEPREHDLHKTVKNMEDEIDRKFSKIGSTDIDEKLSVELVKGYGLTKKELKEHLGDKMKVIRRKNANGS